MPFLPGFPFVVPVVVQEEPVPMPVMILAGEPPLHDNDAESDPA
jgi:hypothetical protein